MYRWLRNTHLLLGVFSLLFVLMYGMSGIQMAHNSWFTARPAVVEDRVALSPQDLTPRAVGRALMEHRGLRGEIAQVRDTPAGFAFRILRPGTVYDVEYSRATSEARVRTSTATFIGMLNRIHHVAGLWHEYPLINLWGIFVGVVSCALLLLGATGIYLWFKLHAERRIGAALLALSLGYSLTLIVLLRNP
jgi:hypothetical protein